MGASLLALAKSIYYTIVWQALTLRVHLLLYAHLLIYMYIKSENLRVISNKIIITNYFYCYYYLLLLLLDKTVKTVPTGLQGF